MTSNGLHWYVAYVRSCQEKKCASDLKKLGVEYFLPVQLVKKKYSDRMKWVEQLVLPRMIFIHTDEKTRIRLLDDVYALCSYMAAGTFKPVIVPDREMNDFRFMLKQGGGKVRVSCDLFQPGDRVKVVSGPLEGLVCELVSVGEKRCVAVRLGAIGTATLDISMDDLVLQT